MVEERRARLPRENRLWAARG